MQSYFIENYLYSLLIKRNSVERVKRITIANFTSSFIASHSFVLRETRNGKKDKGKVEG